MNSPMVFEFKFHNFTNLIRLTRVVNPLLIPLFPW